jgi:hypothetical protein
VSTVQMVFHIRISHRTEASCAYRVQLVAKMENTASGMHIRQLLLSRAGPEISRVQGETKT